MYCVFPLFCFPPATLEEFAGLQAEAMWTTLLFGVLLLRLRMAAKKRKMTAAWVTTIMNKSILRCCRSGTSYCEMRAETEAAREQREAWTVSPPFFSHISLLF